MSDLDLASRIALPSRIGQTIGQQVWGEPYIVFPWIAYMEQRVVEAILDTTHERYLIINAPPSTGKSSYVGMLLPFWITGMFPSWQVMYITYSDDFSVARGKDVRTFHQLYGRDLFGSSIDSDFSSAADWRVVGGRGGMLSVGVGGLITGRPGHCFPGETLISTPDGPRRIDWLARNGGNVWGYDHASGSLVARPVVAGASKGPRPLVEISLTSGRSFRCTTDHPVYVEGVGYVEAGLVEVGSKVRTVRDIPLRRLRQARDHAGVRLGQEAADAQRGYLLHAGVFRRQSPRVTNLRRLRRTRPKEEALLFAGVSGCRPEGAPSVHPVPVVRQEFSPGIQPHPTLFQGVRQPGPLGAHDGGGQLTLQARNVVLDPVLTDEGAGAGAGRWEMRHLRGDGATRRTSRRRMSRPQPAREPRHSLSFGPHEASQVGHDSVSLVAAVRGGDVEVFDIQVEGTSNFFAEEVLVHNCIIIDDLIKNAIEARSKASKSGHLSEWDGTIHTRLQPGGTVVIIATRWAEDDLSGALIARMDEPGYDGPQWEVLEFPAFAEPSDREERDVEDIDAWRDILGRSAGEVLDCRFSRVPGREPDDYFNMKKSSMDMLAWSALYQQKPSSREGGMFPVENWQYYEPGEEPVPDKEVRVWDLAATEGGGDWTAGTKIARCGDRFYITDVRRFRKNAGGVQDEVLRCAGIDGFGAKIMIEEERGGSGKSVTEAFRRLLVGHTVEPAKAEGSKESRATPYSAEQHKRRVFLPRPGSVSWDVNAFIDEHKRMMGDGRRGAHDDMVDTAAYAMLELLGSGIVEMWVPNQSNWMSPEAQMNALIGQSPYL